MINIGDCFTLRIFGTPHLHIVVQDQRPGEEFGQVICVYLCSVGNKTRIDERTRLKKGDHPFITEDSFVKYRNVIVETKSDLEKRIHTRYPRLRTDILEHIQAQFSHARPYENIRKGVIDLFNEWRMNQIYKKPDF
jgi:hypothetical protein